MYLITIILIGWRYRGTNTHMDIATTGLGAGWATNNYPKQMKGRYRHIVFSKTFKGSEERVFWVFITKECPDLSTIKKGLYDKQLKCGYTIGHLHKMKSRKYIKQTHILPLSSKFKISAMIILVLKPFTSNVRETGWQKKYLKKNVMQWHTQTHGHRDLETESAQWANSVKTYYNIWFVNHVNPSSGPQT